MIGAPLTAHQKAEAIETIVKAVDRIGREMEEKWGVGRLPTLVPIVWAERFRDQQRRFSAAVWAVEPVSARKQGEAMLRAYEKLDALAVASGAKYGPSEQWEFEGPDGLIVLVRDISRVGQARLDGRAAAVWSLDEIASVIRNHPILAKAKSEFAGAVVESIRPGQDVKDALGDKLALVPF